MAISIGGEVGLIETTVGRALTVMIEWPFCVGSETDVAVRQSVTDAGEGSVAGGVYIVEVLGPAVLMEPEGVPVQPAPVRTHITFGLTA